MKVLLTAFDPFGGEKINPAQEAVMRIPERVGRVRIEKCVVPTVFGKSVETAAAAIERFRPDAVLCVGQAGGRDKLTVERVAINLEDASIPDNEGNQPLDIPVIPGGENAYFSTLPVKAIAAAIREAGIPAVLSCSAGTFVCNHLMYGVLHLLKENYPTVRGGFMHVPYIPEQVKEGSSAPSMPLREIVRGIEIAIRTIAEHDDKLTDPKGDIN